ncbi:MAG: hypothetical protein HFI44_08010 [Lachnospiraceae bacterium]|nr:hypothetical protein [Lachnospiraceae bacterium]GFI02089.1 hypothetical protein IMSAGC005_00916 [Lachnospiraceae bacterium]
MFSVILIWLYMLFTCYVIGFACIRLLRGKEAYQCRKETSYLYAGIGAVTVYAQFFSIFWKVGLWANLILLLICILCVVALKRQFLEELQTCRLTISPIKAVLILALFLIFAYGTSTGIIHYDTGLYHAQSIRWIEEYGVVPGLGNLHSRLAYNSAAFCLSALYSMAFLGGQSYHCAAGFLAFLLALVCMEAFTRERIKSPRISDFARLAAVYYLLIIFDEMVSPASDYFMVLLVFFIIIRWLDLMEWKERLYLPYAFLGVLGVVVLTVKLSGALILFLVLKPAFMMIREKRGKDIFRFLSLGVLTVLPFLVRNVILSGWLIYPFTALDFFSFAFKIPKGMAEYDAREIQVYGRGFSDVERYGEPIMDWLPEWIRNLDATNKAFLAMALGGVILLLLLTVYAIWKKKKDMIDFLHVAGTLAVCFLFWLFSAPLIRYGCVFLWLLPVLVWGYLYLKISPHLDRFKIYFILLAVFGVYKLSAFGIEVYKGASGRYLIYQKDYENFETMSYELHGVTFYYPVSGDRVGYRDFPSAPQKAEDIFLGDTIEDGFRDIIHS